jgi:hypothetical protein
MKQVDRTKTATMQLQMMDRRFFEERITESADRNRHQQLYRSRQRRYDSSKFSTTKRGESSDRS